MIDLAETALPDVLSGNPEPAVETLRSRLAVADAFVIITPEYNHSFPAPLKTAIDWCSQEWRADRWPSSPTVETRAGCAR